MSELVRADATDLWPRVRSMLDGSPCWCVSSEAPHVGWVHSPVCTARRIDRVLVVDDKRAFRFPATYARTTLEAEAALFRPDGWDEVWWDHDLGPDTTRPLAARLEAMHAWGGGVPRVGRVVVHTANPVGRDWLIAALGRVYGRVEVVDPAEWLQP